MEGYLFGFISATALVSLVLFRFVSVELRKALAEQLFGWSRRSKPYIPAPVAPARPPVRYGNILPVEAESDQPDAPDVFKFPETYEATLPYEDFNRRLIVFEIAPANNSPLPLFPTRISDEPIRIRGTNEYLDRIIREQFRPAYPVILDTTGSYASLSARLEWDPLFVSPLSQVLLSIPEADRPVIISVINPGQHQLKGLLTFIRYGFEDYSFDPNFLGNTGRLNALSLAMLFNKFLGPADTWMWFSRARLQYEIVSRDRASATLAQKLKEDAEAEARRAQKLEKEREDDDTYENFAELFGISNPPAPEASV